MQVWWAEETSLKTLKILSFKNFWLVLETYIFLILIYADRPVTYLYNTLHYYERHLRDRTSLKRKLVHAIISSLKDNRMPGWCLSETYLKCGMNPREDNVWIPDDTYYCKLIGRLVDNILYWATTASAVTLRHGDCVRITEWP